MYSWAKKRDNFCILWIFHIKHLIFLSENCSKISCDPLRWQGKCIASWQLDSIKSGYMLRFNKNRFSSWFFTFPILIIMSCTWHVSHVMLNTPKTFRFHGGVFLETHCSHGGVMAEPGSWQCVVCLQVYASFWVF